MEVKGLEQELIFRPKFEDMIKIEISGKKFIFFDLMVWNYFADEKYPIFNRIKDKLIELVSHNKVLCPITASLLLEISKNENKEVVAKAISLMDGLSHKIFISHMTAILDRELTFAYLMEYFGTGKTDVQKANYVFCHAFNAFSPGGMSLTYPVGFPANIDKIQSVTKEIFEKIQAEPLQNYLVFPKDNDTLKRIEDKIIVEKSKDRDKSIEWHIENNMNIFINEKMDMLLNSSKEIIEFIKEKLHKDISGKITIMKDILMKCPSAVTAFTIDACLSKAIKEPVMNDLYDTFHIKCAFPYVHFYITDKSMYSRIKEAKLDERFGTKVFSAGKESIIEFEKELDLL